MGIEWRDIDFNRQIVTINRTSNYNKTKGIYTDSPKTKSSYRTLRLTPELMNLLWLYKLRQEEYIQKVGDSWVTEIKGLNDELVPNDRLFTQWDGKPMHPNAPSLYFERFCNRHGFRYLSLHSCRHFVASALINARLDVKTVQLYLGHAAATTTLQIYTHEFQTAEAAAMDAIGGVVELPALGFTDRRSLGLLGKSQQRLFADKPSLLPHSLNSGRQDDLRGYGQSPSSLPPDSQDTERQAM